MSRSLRRPVLLACLFAILGARAHAQVVAYTDEAAFLADLAALGYAPAYESFEDDALWGHVRSGVPTGTHSAPSVHAQGLTWLPNNATSEVTTSNGPARTGQWGFYQIPHGDPVNLIHDGFGATGDQALVAVGGWIETNTPLAKISLWLDGVEVDFSGGTTIDTQHRFFGAIDLAGFAHFEYLELEAQPDDWKYVFADDFHFAFGGNIVDCNQNGVPDALDLQAGTSGDCNSNQVPDECEISEDSTAPGGPFFCQQNCDPDCNDNGQLDACEVVTPLVLSSGQLSPFGDGAPQSATFASPPPTRGNALVDLSAYSNLGGPDEFVEVRLNGALLGVVFVDDGDDCPEPDPSATRLVVPKDVFNDLVAGGDATFQLVASSEVDANDCDSPSWIALELTLFVPSAQDADGDGVPDECQVPVGTVYCACDGSGHAPPCSNPGAPARGCANGTYAEGCALSASGGASVANDTLVLHVSSSTPGQPGLFFQGDNRVAGGDGAPFGDGLRCAGGAVVRLQVRVADAGGAAATTLSIADRAGLQPGDMKRYQWWYRDPALSPCQTGFNLSNGLELAWGP